MLVISSKLIIIISSLLCLSHGLKQKNFTTSKPATTPEPKKVEEHKEDPRPKLQQKPVVIIPRVHIKKKIVIKTIQPEVVQGWAKEISDSLLENEALVVRRSELLTSISADVKAATRNGSAIVEQMAASLEELLGRRARAAEAIMKRAEGLSSENPSPPEGYVYDYSVDIDQLKRQLEREDQWDLPETCRSLERVPVAHSEHFDGKVSLDTTSVQVAGEVFDCAPSVVKNLYWSEGLLSVFKENYAQDSTMDFQYFCSAKGFLRTYPAALWSSMFKIDLNVDDVYDCRLRPWYVSASGAPRDVLILLDASGSMDNSSNQVIAEQFTLAMLSALTDDDHVNVLRFNVVVNSPIRCFDDKLVPANHVNSAAMLSELKEQPMHNETDMDFVLRYAVRMLQKQRNAPERPPACQQAIILVTDSISYNYTQLLRDLDPSGRIRLFVMWLHDRFGLRDNTQSYGEWISCDRDGYYAELVTDSDVTEQVSRILRVLERPLVAQRKERLRVYSDVFVHVEDPRRSERYWKQKENAEQVYRYQQLRKNKQKLLNDTYLHHQHQESLDTKGFYNEGPDRNYKLQISVSVPVFESTTLENITILLDEEDPRNATRTYPVNRLLGVAGVDIPIDHIKLLLPYYKLGAGGSLFLTDHRGNIVIHDNLKPVFDGDILKPGYRTVDFIDLEQPAKPYEPRDYPEEWKEFRKSLVIQHSKGSKVMYGKNIYDYGLRASLEQREYHWKRVADHYTAVVVLPPYGRKHAVSEGAFTQQLAAEALKTLSRSDFAVQPDWSYCRHVEPYFDLRESELLHFIRRRSDEPNFAMKKLKHLYSVIPPGLLDKTYQCNEELMARLCKEAVATSQWASEHGEQECEDCTLGSVTAFFAGESGLTRWQHYRVVSPHAAPPSGAAWSGGAAEAWYQRAVAAAPELVVHAPVLPIRRMRNTDATPPSGGTRAEWLTAARVLAHPEKGVLGVAGFHFYPQHLEDLLVAVTNNTCDTEDPDCKPSCDGQDWSCVVVDEGGWIVAGAGEGGEGGSRVHLASAHPAAMAALLGARVYTLNWLHDYQAVCFSYVEHSSAAQTLPSLLRSIWRSIHLIIRMTQEVTTLITILKSGSFVYGDTQKERDKRRNRLRRDFEREKYERLYDKRVLVNRTRFAACDRSRAFYELQNTAEAAAALRRAAAPCSWPLTAARVPHTNLLLLAIYTRCEPRGPPVPDPALNEPVNVTKLIARKKMNWGKMSPASELACWRNYQPLAARPPRRKCHPHNHTQEEGYRQCGLWLPDPEVKINTATSHLTPYLPIFILFLIICFSVQ